LRGLRADVGDVKAELRATREEMATKADLNSPRADVASDLANMSEQIAGLKKETREQLRHLDLPSLEALRRPSAQRGLFLHPCRFAAA
jgi:hypothetical protein